MEATTRRRVVLDAYPLIALLRGEAAADEVYAGLVDHRVVVSVVTLGEVADVLVRGQGHDALEVSSLLQHLLDDGMSLNEPSVATATRAGLLRSAWYRRRVCEVSLADCFVVATAQPGDCVMTADPALARVARGEGFEVVAIPDSRGRRP